MLWRAASKCLVTTDVRSDQGNADFCALQERPFNCLSGRAYMALLSPDRRR